MHGGHSVLIVICLVSCDFNFFIIHHFVIVVSSQYTLCLFTTKGTEACTEVATIYYFSGYSRILNNEALFAQVKNHFIGLCTGGITPLLLEGIFQIEATKTLLHIKAVYSLMPFSVSYNPSHTYKLLSY